MQIAVLMAQLLCISPSPSVCTSSAIAEQNENYRDKVLAHCNRIYVRMEKVICRVRSALNKTVKWRFQIVKLWL